MCLFTCANTRAIYFELVPDLTAETFLRAFGRFCMCSKVHSREVHFTQRNDVPKCRQGSKTTLQQSIGETLYMAARSVNWTFIPKRAAWWGGFYERLIGLTKKSIQKVLGWRYVTFDEMDTILCEVEAAINDRPLTCVCSDLTDDNPLTPSQLLHGRLITLPPCEHLDSEELFRPILRQ